MYDIQVRIASLRVITSLHSLSKSSYLLGISKASLSRWTKRLHPSPWNRKPHLSTPSLISNVKELLRNKLYFSLQSLQNDLSSFYDSCPSKQLLHLILRKRLGFSFKRTKKRGVPRNRNNTIDVRQRYVSFLREYVSCLERRTLVSVDECGFDHRCVPTYAYSPKGTPAIASYSTTSDRSRYTLNMAISANDGSHVSNLSPSFCKANDFCLFLEQLPYPRGTVIVLDNASIHKTNTVMDTASMKGYGLLFIPPYTPEANPIELVFGVLKNAYYKLRFQPDFESVLSTVRHALSVLSNATILNSFRHTSAVLGRLCRL